jgi:hypothetical protein
MCKVFADTWNSTDGRRILSAWCDIEEDIKQELRRAMIAAVNTWLQIREQEILYGKPGGIEPIGIIKRKGFK